MTSQTFKADGARVTAYLDGPLWEDKATATLGGFSAKTAEAGADVLAQAFTHIRTAEITRVIGPMDGDTWHKYRFITETDDSPAFLMEPTNTALEAQVFTDAGFTQISQYFSARAPLDTYNGPTPPQTDDFKIEQWDGTNPEALFSDVYDLSTTAFENNAFYKPIDRDTFLAMYLPMVPMIRPELIFFARRPDNSLAGFLFGIPNYAEGPQTRTAILKTYASLSRGAGQHLSHAFHTTARDAGFTTAIHALIHEDNTSAERSAAEGGTIFRRYGLFGLHLS